MNIKTVTTTTGMNTVVFGNSANMYYWVKNIGSTDITVGATNNAENHAIVKPDNGIRVDTFTNTVYISGAGTVEIYECNTPVCPFKSAQRGGDITASGNPIQIDRLQGGVPFSEITVSGKNLLKYPYMTESGKVTSGVTFTVNADGSITLNGTSTAYGSFNFTSRTTKDLLLNGTYTLSGATADAKLAINATRDGKATTIIRTQSSSIFTTSYHDNDNEYGFAVFVEFDAGKIFDNVTIFPQIELGNTATEYEPPITGRELTVNVNGTEHTITPDSNPYVIPNDIRQQDGHNVVSVSGGVLSVTGCKSNMAVKRIWDKLDELATAIIVANGEIE